MIEIAPKSLQDLSIEQAFLYTITCTHNNKHDWRLPTGTEAVSHALINKGWRNSAKDNWTSTTWDNSSYYPCVPVRDNND